MLTRWDADIWTKGQPSAFSSAGVADKFRDLKKASVKSET
jgi:hypothetical protein